jgi:hypothetical protein
VGTAVRIMIAVVGVTLAANAGAAGSVPDACRLMSRGEIQRAIGRTATGFEHATTFRNGSTSMCEGNVGGATVTLRVSIESEQDRANEQTIAKMISSSGGQVKTVEADGVACMTVIPPASMMEYGFDSMCKVNRDGREVAIQSSTHERQAMVPVARLRPLVTLAADRLGAAGH